MLSKWNINLFGNTFSFIFRVTPDKTVLHYGMGNRCSDGKYVLFLDYDNVPLEWVQEDVRLLQDEYRGLNKAYLFKTKNGFHVVFLEKFFIDVVYKMMSRTSCDKSYKDVPMFCARKVWVLRQSKKKSESIQYLGIVNPLQLASPPNVEKSFAHGMYLHKVMKVPQEDLSYFMGNWDNGKDLEIGYYHISQKDH